MKKALFVCVENAGRSQIAEAFSKKYAEGKFIVSSAGNKPADKIDSVVLEAMKEKGFDLSMSKPKLLTCQMVQDANLIVTMGCNDQGICPGHSLSQPSTGNLKTPKEKPLKKYEKSETKSSG